MYGVWYAVYGVYVRFWPTLVMMLTAQAGARTKVQTEVELQPNGCVAVIWVVWCLNERNVRERQVLCVRLLLQPDIARRPTTALRCRFMCGCWYCSSDTLV